MQFGNSLVQSSSASASVSKADANIATNPASTAATPSNDHTEEDQGTESGGGNKRRRGGGNGSRKKTSIAWKHFEEFLDEETGIRKGRCNYCGVEYFADPNKNGTSSMIAHIPKCDNNPNNPKNRSTQTQLAFGNKEVDEITGKMKANLLSWKFDQDVVRKAVAYMIIVDELPFRFVEGRGFRHLMSVACPYFSVPCRTTMNKDCYDLYLAENDKLKYVMKSSTGRICFTTDTWTSLQKVNYMCLTAHFIDDKWRLHKRVLNFCPILSHKGTDIGEAMLKCWQEWGINNVFTITVDNASSNDTAIAYLKKKFSSWNKCILGGKWSHVRCIAHIMHLIVKQGLEEYHGGIESIRAAIKYVRQSPSRLKSFKEAVLMEGVEYKKHLCLDVATRWNSTYLMLSSAIGYAKVFESYCDTNAQMKEVLEKPHGPGIPTYLDWEDAKRLTSFLESFYNLTVQISGTKYITANEFLAHITDVDALLKFWSKSFDEQMSKMSKSMIDKFDKYWGDVTKMNKLIFIAAAMDPRRKMSYVTFILAKLYGKEKGAEISEQTKEAMQEMFGEYMKLYSPPEVSLTSSAATGSVSQSGEVNSQVSTDLDPRAQIRAQYEEEFECFDIDVNEVSSELEKYLKEGREPKKTGFDVLHWWRDNSARFPILSQMARDVLAVPISTVASESTFSTSGRVLDSFRSSLTPKIVQALICAQDWLRSAGEPLTVEESLEDLCKFEEDMAVSGRENNVIDRL